MNYEELEASQNDSLAAHESINTKVPRQSFIENITPEQFERLTDHIFDLAQMNDDKFDLIREQFPDVANSIAEMETIINEVNYERLS